MKFKKRYIIIIVLLILIAAAVFFINKYDLISALKYSQDYTKEELNTMMSENSEKLDDEIRTYFNNELREYTEEELAQLESGEVTSDVLLAKIIAEKYEDGDTAEPKVSSDTKSGTSVKTSSNASAAGASEAEAITAKYVSRLYSLQGTYLGKLDGLLDSAISEYKAVPKEERSKTKMVSIASKYIPKGYALESKCDSQVNSMLASLKKELDAVGADTSIVSTIRSHYQSEKSMKKAYYLNLIK